MDLTAERLAELLGRPLTPVETANRELYLEIAFESLEDLICTPIAPVNETRVFDVREGYTTAFVDIFNLVEEVKINDSVIETDDFSIRQWDKRNGSWYNSIVYTPRKFRKNEEIEVTAQWGFEVESDGESDADEDDYLPADLQAAVAGLFGLITKQNKLDRTINSKKVEDFSISYNHSSITMNDTLMESFVKDFGKTIAKYSLCDIPDVQHGRTRHGHRI